MSLSYLRAILILDPLIILTTIFMGSVSVLCSFFDGEGRAQFRVARAWARMLLRIAGVKMRVEGLERLDPTQSYVLAGNHLSLMDTPVVLGTMPLRFLFMANEKYFRIPFLGTHLRRSGNLPVASGDPRASMRTMTEAARIIRERKLSMVLFPEGSRSRGEMQDFKEGAAYIAIKAGVPIVPMAIRGTREVLPVGSIHVKPGPVSLRLGEPIPTEGLTLKDRAALTETLRARVIDLLGETPARQSAASGL
ncbi:MAG: lysophospholipid acyltransferase family protein [Bryobacteraceae bacterium]